MELNLRRLRILREVAHHGGVSVAAREMHYSPSGISQQMAALEQDIGAPVLERRGRGIVLTAVGRVLLEHAEILLAAEADAQTAIEQTRDTLAVELTVGVFSTVAAGLIPGIVDDLALRHPEVRLRTREIDPDDAGMELRHGHLDLAFLIDYPDATEPWAPGITIVPATHDEPHLAAPPGRSPPPTLPLADTAPPAARTAQRTPRRRRGLRSSESARRGRPTGRRRTASSRWTKTRRTQRSVAPR